MPQRFSIGKTDYFPSGKPKAVKVNGTSIVVAQTENGYCAVENRCPHMNLPLAGGKLEDGIISCPFHNSRFDMCSGENVDWVQGVGPVKLPGVMRGVLSFGKKAQPIETYTVVEEDGELYIEIA